MDSSTIDELLEVFSDHQTYYYYKDKFVIDRILEKSAGSGINPQAMRASGLAKEANNPLVKKLLAKANGALDRQELFAYWPDEGQCFNITFSKWGEAPKPTRKVSWYQTSRSGFSLVLQLNFSTEHNHDFFRLLRPVSGIRNWQYGGHPIALERFVTLGWCRLDVDFETNEVLIEELQTDWLREFIDMEKSMKAIKTEANTERYLSNRGFATSKRNWLNYMDIMRIHKAIWSEALLHAAVQFAKKELGISNVWMHTYDSGNLFKDLKWSRPPKSLYTKLPRKYGFEQVEGGPKFLQAEKYLRRYFKTARQKRIAWYKLPATN